MKQSGAAPIAHKQASVIEEPPPDPVLPGGDSAMVANSQPPAVLSGIVATPSPASAPKTVSHIKAPHLITATPPQYPAIAKTARIQGTVVLEATISKSGAIENLKAVSGPPMLYQAAIDAVRQWRYKPYMLNGEPVEVGTTVNVIFSLNGGG